MHLQNAMVKTLSEHNLQAPFKWAWNAPYTLMPPFRHLPFLQKAQSYIFWMMSTELSLICLPISG
ncbi:Hypothetical protein FKW44_006774 [Caligus rogercresseyi]|uniref:Uncharacterized protein n=1 Tax=Caligus rogercresseyi TaxID=217165 RepID=A0A7T8KDT4_CALRO|nr:Hypothetical protein FKW44_006774 [Caligus rogercresseyi]